MISEVSNAKNVLLFIDELHTIIGAGGAEGSLDASNILKPALARGEVQVIGATTIEGTANTWKRMLRLSAVSSR